jgi:hypothetical protein
VPRRSIHGPIRNENRTAIIPLLDDIKELKQSYKSAPESIDRCDDLIRKILGRLKRKGVRDAFDTLLNDENSQKRAWPGVEISKADLKDEIKLASDFGYSAREVKRYVERARREGASKARFGIAATEDLMRELKQIHERARQDMGKPGSRIERWRTIRRAREDAKYQLYCVGVIIADGMTSDLFGTSYSVGTSGLAKGGRK